MLELLTTLIGLLLTTLIGLRIPIGWERDALLWCIGAYGSVPNTKRDAVVGATLTIRDGSGQL